MRLDKYIYIDKYIQIYIFTTDRENEQDGRKFILAAWWYHWSIIYLDFLSAMKQQMHIHSSSSWNKSIKNLVNKRPALGSKKNIAFLHYIGRSHSKNKTGKHFYKPSGLLFFHPSYLTALNNYYLFSIAEKRYNFLSNENQIQDFVENLLRSKATDFYTKNTTEDLPD